MARIHIFNVVYAENWNLQNKLVWDIFIVNVILSLILLATWKVICLLMALQNVAKWYMHAGEIISVDIMMTLRHC